MKNDIADILFKYIKRKKRSTPKRKIIYIISGRQARDN